MQEWDSEERSEAVSDDCGRVCVSYKISQVRLAASATSPNC